MREEFEKHIKQRGWLESNIWYKGEKYGFWPVQIAWEAYQAGYKQGYNNKVKDNYNNGNR